MPGIVRAPTCGIAGGGNASSHGCSVQQSTSDLRRVESQHKPSDPVSARAGVRRLNSGGPLRRAPCRDGHRAACDPQGWRSLHILNQDEELGTLHKAFSTDNLPACLSSRPSTPISRHGNDDKWLQGELLTNSVRQMSPASKRWRVGSVRTSGDAFRQDRRGTRAAA